MSILVRRWAALVLAGLFTIPVPAWGGAPSGRVGPDAVEPGALTVHEGDLVVSTPGEVVEDLEIRGSLTVAAGATGVVVRNVWVYSEGFWTVYVEPGASATFEHVEIGHPDAVGERGIGGDSVTARYLDIHDVEDGVKLGSDSVYEFIYVHDLASPNPDPHADAVQVEGEVRNAVIRNSTLDSRGRVGLGNAALQIGSDLGPVRSLRFESNYLNGGAYTVFVDDAGFGLPENIVFISNRFGPDHAFGLSALDGPVLGAGNVDADGEPVDLGPVPPDVGDIPPAPPVGFVPTTAPTSEGTTGTVTVPSDGIAPPSTTTPAPVPPAESERAAPVWAGALGVLLVAAGAAFSFLRRR